MQNKIILILIFFCHFGCLNAQSPSYVNFEWDLFKGGYLLPIGSFQKSRTTVGTELRINILNSFSLGLSSSVAFYDSFYNSEPDVTLVSTSYLLVGDYYLRDDSGKRIFLGTGFGTFALGEYDPQLLFSLTSSTTSGFGITPRVGYEFGHGRLLGQYNMTFGKGHHDYFELTVALTLWGGYKGNVE